jgi:hypothetical protein
MSVSRHALVFSACVGISLVAMPHWAYAALEQLTLTLPQAPANTTDLDLTVDNSVPFTFANEEKWPRGEFNSAGGVKTDDTHATITYLGGSPGGEVMTIGFQIDTAVQNFHVDSIGWSFKHGNDQPIPGLVGARFKMTPVKDPMVDFTITNNSVGYLLFSNVATLSNSLDLPLGDPVGSIPGFVPLWATLLLAPGQTSPDFISSTVDPGNFVYVEGTAFVSDATGDELSGGLDFRYGHQTPIPEPPTWAMLIAGFVALALAALFRSTAIGSAA